MNPHVDSNVLEGWHAETFIQGENTLIIVSDRRMDDMCRSLEEELDEEGIRVLHVHDLDRIVADARPAAQRGEAPAPVHCRIYDVMSDDYASRLIEIDPMLAQTLPHRISVMATDDVVTVTCARPTTVVGEYSGRASAARLATSFEASLRQVVRRLQR